MLFIFRNVNYKIQVKWQFIIFQFFPIVIRERPHMHQMSNVGANHQRNVKNQEYLLWNKQILLQSLNYTWNN